MHIKNNALIEHIYLLIFTSNKYKIFFLEFGYIIPQNHSNVKKKLPKQPKTESIICACSINEIQNIPRY